MGSKRYKNKLCVYCANRQSVTADHVFAREFFLPNHRGNHPQVPACEPCNNSKSTLEHYLTTILPFGGRHRDSLETLTSLVPKRLAKNQKLRRNLASRSNRVWSIENGICQRATAVPLKAGNIERLFGLIAKGLAWHHWKIYFTEEHELETLILTQAGQQFFEQSIFRLNAAQRVQINLGGGAIQYEGIQGVDCPHVTVWRFTIYGGLIMCGDPEALGETCSQIAVITGQTSTFQRAELRRKFELRFNPLNPLFSLTRYSGLRSLPFTR